MRSTKFGIIFDAAASIVERRCKGLMGVRTVLDEIKRRGDSLSMSPLENRDLIVEPMIESQLLNVPLHTAECVASELHGLNILHKWVRARCPIADPEHGDNVIVETDSSKQFREALMDPCPYCAQYHEDIPLGALETFYAIHFDDNPDDFDLRRFLKKGPLKRNLTATTTRDITEGSPDKPTAGKIADTNAILPRITVVEKASNETEAVAVIAHDLQENRRTTHVPHINEVFVIYWKLSLSGLVVVCLVATLAYKLIGPLWAIVIISTFILVFTFYTYLALRAFFSAPLLPRMMITACNGLSIMLLATSRFEIDAGIGQGVPGWIKFKSGETHWLNILGSILLMLISGTVIFKYQKD
jgi:hypothetical protein